MSVHTAVTMSVHTAQSPCLYTQHSHHVCTQHSHHVRTHHNQHVCTPLYTAQSACPYTTVYLSQQVCTHSTISMSVHHSIHQSTSLYTTAHIRVNMSADKCTKYSQHAQSTRTTTAKGGRETGDRQNKSKWSADRLLTERTTEQTDC